MSFSWSSSTISETKSLLTNYDYILLFGYHNWILRRYISFFKNNIGCIYAEQMQYFLDVCVCDQVACHFFLLLLLLIGILLKEKSCKYI